MTDGDEIGRRIAFVLSVLLVGVAAAVGVGLLASPGPWRAHHVATLDTKGEEWDES